MTGSGKRRIESLKISGTAQVMGRGLLQGGSVWLKDLGPMLIAG